jgi:hypothetical protein
MASTVEARSRRGILRLLLRLSGGKSERGSEQAADEPRDYRSV